MNAKLKSYLSKNPKYKLVFDISSSLQVASVDAGVFLSGALHAQLKKSAINMYASDAVRSMIRKHTHEDAEIGRYVAVKNIGILFEPALAFNLETIIEQTAKDELLIIQASGVIENDKFYFLSPQHNLSINLKNLSYTVIE